MEKNKNEVIEIDIKQIIMLLLSKALYIGIVGVVFAIFAFTYFKFVAQKQYTSSAQLYVMNTESDTLTSSDITVYNYITKDCMEIITTRPVLEKVIAELGLDMSVGTLKSKISASNSANSRLITITVSDTSPVMAKRIVDSLSKASAQHIKEVTKAEFVNPVFDGEVATAPSSPNVMRNSLIALILGLAVGCAIVVIRFLLDDSIKGAEDVEKYLGISVIGTIPLFGEDEDLGVSYKHGAKVKKSAMPQRPQRPVQRPQQAGQRPVSDAARAEERVRRMNPDGNAEMRRRPNPDGNAETRRRANSEGNGAVRRRSNSEGNADTRRNSDSDRNSEERR
ncbi:MAG: hypothetical protein E7266_09750 [Lachnospiraceae bacterium]|nr:hypothetical protein [Lachnospiraceae bacterium]